MIAFKNIPFTVGLTLLESYPICSACGKTHAFYMSFSRNNGRNEEACNINLQKTMFKRPHRFVNWHTKQTRKKRLYKGPGSSAKVGVARHALMCETFEMPLHFISL